MKYTYEVDVPACTIVKRVVLELDGDNERNDLDVWLAVRKYIRSMIEGGELERVTDYDLSDDTEKVMPHSIKERVLRVCKLIGDDANYERVISEYIFT